MLVAEGISRRINDRAILNNVSVRLDAGEIVALLGPSGCGKTTLLRSLVLVDPPDDGQIDIADASFVFPLGREIDRRNVYPTITIVFQQFQLFPHLTVYDNLTLPVKTILTEKKLALLQHLLNTLGIENLLHRYPHQISVGEKQRVAFARAAMLEPKYLLLDEVTSSLDIEHISRLMVEIKRLASDGAGILLTTHLVGFAKSIADRVYFMDKGEIVEHGTAEILETPSSERLKTFISLLNIVHRPNRGGTGEGDLRRPKMG